jgi:hypothetical protein
MEKCAKAYSDVINDVNGNARCRQAASELRLREREGAERRCAALINCAQLWLRELGKPKEARRCLRQAKETAGRGMDDLALCAAAWQELLQNAGQARHCLQQANEVAQDSDEWLQCARYWVQILKDKRQCRICLGEGMAVATGTLELINCGDAWKELLGDHHSAGECYQNAQRRARKTTAYLSCARAWNGADPERAASCMERAKAAATRARKAQDWLDCGRACQELFGSGNEARCCFEQAERTAGDCLSDWAACYEAWRGIANGAAGVERCLERYAGLQDHEQCPRRLEIARRFKKFELQDQQQPPAPEVRADFSEDAFKVLCRRLPSRGLEPQEGAAIRHAKNAIFFYPACGFDLEPLYRFSGGCDTFIFCDNGGLRKADFGTLFNFEHHPDHARGRLHVEGIEALPDLLIRHLSEARGDPWGLRVFVSCNNSAPPRLVQLWYFSIEGVLLYRNLFNRRSWAPEFVCIKRNSEGFESWNSPFAKLVHENQAIPRFLVSERPAGYGYDWPWKQRWLTFNTWHGMAPEHVYVYHQPEVIPTEQERRAFRLPGIPEIEWPE